ncbi:unnamed protein product (mitochondrion) [Plasmodiophora brassicae]|uniref:Pyruvate dehydrogenase E1 component subunit alpha n=1 Tax=Plasmodiophora brassicae TaxID=37360 RepID=A0A3P3Y729_PLABS|nr:unnamed protein product [Plasmodiophora brassicae]
MVMALGGRVRGAARWRRGGGRWAARRLSGSASMTVEFAPFAMHRVEGAPTQATVTKQDLLGYYDEMQVMRRMEIVCDQLYKTRLIRGFCHLYDGQEAIAMGLRSGLHKDDYVISAYRDHALQYAAGDTLESIMAELLGKSTGCSKGKGGSMHLYYPKGYFGFYGGNGIVGAQVPLGAGLAFEAKYRDNKRVAVAMYGDGAANQGQLFEAANMAALWDLPLILMCENNQYGMGTATSRASASPDFYTRGDFIPGIKVDGMDVVAAREAVKWAADYCRAGNGPMFIEMKTYRYHGHSMSDPGVSYRSRDEVASMRQERDCIGKVKRMLLENEWATEADLKAIDKKNKARVDKAVEFAKESKELPPEELFTDIYEFGPPKFVSLQQGRFAHTCQ